jgi:hypothetical protein
MNELKHADCLITDAKAVPHEIQTKYDKQREKGQSSLETTHLLNVDGERIKDFFFVDCSWLWKGSTQSPVEETHIHEFGEVIGFVGSSREDAHDLGGEIWIWLDGEKVVLNKSCLIFIPAGVRHCPVQINRIDKPTFFVTMAMVKKYSRLSVNPDSEKPTGGQSPRYTIVTDTNTKFTVAASGEKAPPSIPRDPSLRSTRLLHLEEDIAKGAFYVDFVWIWEGNGGAPAPEHNHDWVEMIAMVGADPEHPRDLGGSMSIVLGDETHLMTRSTLVCIPAGLKHCPWKFIGIKKPTLVFTAGPSGMYSGSHKKIL